MQDQTPIAISDLFPDFTKQELEEAEANLRRYLAALLRMSDRLASEGWSINDLVDCRFAESGDQLYHSHLPKVETHKNH
ncbi:MAG TPA: hypothetical protein VHY84_08455 [Bryobacteraceae bacterium]|nr:hypothetical protein [Bryobacteraceae bacterium]